MRATAGPTWETEQEGGRSRVRLRGGWTLLAIARCDTDLLRGLRRTAERRPDVWDLRDTEALDSAGALLLWRAWDHEMPEELRCDDRQRAWFETLAEVRPGKGRPRPHASALLVALGRRVVSAARETGQVALLAARVARDLGTCVRHPRRIPALELSATVYRAGAQSLVLLGFIGIVVGYVLAYQAAPQLQRFGSGERVIGLVAMAFLRELGPFLTALIVVARSGSAITAGIGAMHLTEEIDALRTLGVSPTLRLVLPRVAGLALAVPLLVMWTNLSGMIGALYVSTRQLDVDYGMWIAELPHVASLENYFISVGKGVFFGSMIGLVASYFGLKAAKDTGSLTAMTTRSVVVGTTLVITIDAAFGILLLKMGV